MCVCVYLQAVRLGQASIAEQCRGIEEWTARLGKEKRMEDLKLPLKDLDDRIMEEIGPGTVKSIVRKHYSSQIASQMVRNCNS